MGNLSSETMMYQDQNNRRENTHKGKATRVKKKR